MSPCRRDCRRLVADLCCFRWRWTEQKVSDAKSKQKHNADLGKPLQEIGGASVDAQAAGAASRPSEHLCGLASATERRKGGRWDKESDGLSECRFKSQARVVAGADVWILVGASGAAWRQSSAKLLSSPTETHKSSLAADAAAGDSTSPPAKTESKSGSHPDLN